MMRKKAKLISMCVIVCTWLSSLLALTIPYQSMANSKIEEKKSIIDSSIIQKQSIKKMDNIKDELILEAEKYVHKNFPKAHKTIPIFIVKYGLERDVDIVFMMAQTQIETCFGTAGIGRENSKRSIFGVMRRKYSTYDEAVCDYVSVLKKFYLTKGRTEQDLMRNYTTTRGARYASCPYYEKTLRKTYAYIGENTKIKQLQLEYKNLKKKIK